ncbi:MAG: hypothetical protein U0793_18965 [Gemmataceae bacterium]
MMKKVFLLGAIALTLTLAQTRQASAWCNFKFGVGLNLQWQSGDNSCLWGLHRSGPWPGSGGGYPYGEAAPFYFGAAPTMSPAGPSFEAPAPTMSAYGYPAPALTYPTYNPYQNVSYGYYMPYYYYPTSWYGR